MGHPTSFRTLRVAGRLANGFVLDRMKLGGHGRGVVDAILKMAIRQANVAQIVRSAELQRAYATLDSPIPEDLLRPVSINAVAASLRLPFETARRKVNAMAAAGNCAIGPKGVIIQNRGGDRAPSDQHLHSLYQLVRELYGRLRSIGLLDALNPADPWDMTNPPVRLVARASSDYVLRICEPLAENIGDLLRGIVLMDILQANTEHLPDTEGGTDDPNVGGFPGDHLRRPVRVSTLSERLGIPQETVRRHVAKLVESNRCVRLDDGYIVPVATLAAAGALTRFMLDNQMHLNRMFSQLAEHGIVAAWHLEYEALRGAA